MRISPWPNNIWKILDNFLFLYRYTIYKSGDTTEWCNLTISNFSISDKGVYTCVAQNEAGIDQRKITLFLGSGSTWLAPNNGDIWFLLLYLIAGKCGGRGAIFQLQSPVASRAVVFLNSLNWHQVLEKPYHFGLFRNTPGVKMFPMCTSQAQISSSEHDSCWLLCININRELYYDIKKRWYLCKIKSWIF